MDSIFQAKQYLKYRLTAGTQHDVHSPFVFDFINTILRDSTPFYAFEPIESIRAAFLLNNNQIDIVDMGASPGIRKRKVADIAGSSLLPARYGQLLFRMVNTYQPKSILELGTSLGITSLYLSMASRKTPVSTIEGSPEIARLAQAAFNRLSAGNIELLVGNFSKCLPEYLVENPSPGLVFIDGNHRYEPTMDYFQKCLKNHSEDSIFIFDDINWSKEMARAWKEISSHPEITISIDLYRLGIVFFRKGIPKQYFRLKF